MTWHVRLRGLATLLLFCGPVLPVQAQFQGLRVLSEAEQRGALAALLAEPQMPMSEDPSCKADLSKPGRVSLAQALSETLARAAAVKPPRTVQVDCFLRRGYPLATGQEYCRLAFIPIRRPHDSGFGLVFVMDWPRKAVVPDRTECY